MFLCILFYPYCDPCLIVLFLCELDYGMGWSKRGKKGQLDEGILSVGTDKEDLKRPTLGPII